VHAADDPHLHAPARHALAVLGSHTAQVPPDDPQAASDGVVQVAPEQQPCGQVAAVHPEQTWLEQVCGDGQLWHCTPPLPHTRSAVPG
jgi:hypothetical protein